MNCLWLVNESDKDAVSAVKKMSMCKPGAFVMLTPDEMKAMEGVKPLMIPDLTDSPKQD